MPLNGGFGCLELVLYGIRELASATPGAWSVEPVLEWSGVGQSGCQSTYEGWEQQT